MSRELHYDPAIIEKWLEGQTIRTIMYGNRSDSLEENRCMGLILYLENGQTIDLWAVPGDFDGESLDDFFEHNKEPRPYLAVSRLDE